MNFRPEINNFMIWALFNLFWAKVYLIVKRIYLLFLRSFLKYEFSYSTIELFNFIKICLHLPCLILLLIFLLLHLRHISLYFRLQTCDDAALIFTFKFVLCNLLCLDLDLLFIAPYKVIQGIDLLIMLEFNQLLYVLYLVWLIGVEILRYHCD